MNKEVDVRKALRVFQKITEEGVKSGDHYTMNGLKALTDFDGYTATICNDYVTLDIFFHNKFSFNYTNAKERETFLEKLNALDK